MRLNYLYPVLLMSLFMALTDLIKAQNVGIGTAAPTQKFEVNGGIRVGGTTIANKGAIRWNATKNDFEGFNGSAWVSLTGGKGKWGDQSSFSYENTASQIGLLDANVPGTELGNALAGEGDWIVAGAYRDASPGNDDKWHTGSIRMMNRIGNEWKHEHSIYDPDAVTNDFFGYSVDITSTHVIAGAPNADMPNSWDQGKAYIYTYDIDVYAHQATLKASDAQPYDNYGLAVALSGDNAAVGAPFNDVLGVNSMGSAYLYTRTGTTWPETQILIPADGEAEDRYGTAIALWGEYLAVGAPFKSYNGFYLAGKVYVYRKIGSSWTLIQEINSPAPNEGELFGIQLVIKDNVLLVGASDWIVSNADSTGFVHIYEINNNTVSYEATIHPSDGQNGDAFGSAIDYNDGTIMVGSYRAAVRGMSRHGKAYIFKETGGIWQEEALLTASSDESKIHFGASVTLVPDYGVVGAPFADLNNQEDNGRLFFFRQY